MDENKDEQQTEQQEKQPAPLSEARKTALLRYMAVLFAVALPEIVAPIVTVLVIWFSHSMGLLSNLPVIYGGILPDLELFNFKASAVYQTVIPWSYVVLVTLWGICYAVFAASLASLIFSRKDIR